MQVLAEADIVLDEEERKTAKRAAIQRDNQIRARFAKDFTSVRFVDDDVIIGEIEGVDGNRVARYLWPAGDVRLEEYDESGENAFRSLASFSDTEVLLFRDESGRKNYALRADASLALSAVLRGNLEGKLKNVLEGKASSTLKASKDKRVLLSVSLGKFKNRFAEELSLVTAGASTTDPAGFAPYLEMWRLYSEGKLGGHEQIIDRFDGIIIAEERGIDEAESADLSSQVRLAANLGALQANIEAESFLSAAKRFSADGADYWVMFTSSPSFVQIPSAPAIRSSWRTFDIEAPRYSSPGLDHELVSADSKPCVFLQFGPVPHMSGVEDKSGRDVDPATLIRAEWTGDHDLVTGSPSKRETTRLPGDMYQVALELPLDESYFSRRDLPDTAQEIGIRLYLDMPVARTAPDESADGGVAESDGTAEAVGEDIPLVLDREYAVRLLPERTPLVRILPLDDPTYDQATDLVTWTARAVVESDSSATAVDPTEIASFACRGEDIKDRVSVDSTSSLDNASGQWSFRIGVSGASVPDGFSRTCKVEIAFEVQLEGSRRKYRRSAEVNPALPEPVTVALSENVTIPIGADLLEVIRDDIPLFEGRTLDDVRGIMERDDLNGLILESIPAELHWETGGLVLGREYIATGALERFE